MPAFTKGKWTVENGIDIISDIHQNAYIAQLYLIPDEKEHEANARLIAAAPDMYNFLVNLYGMIHIPGVKALLDRIHGTEDTDDEHA